MDCEERQKTHAITQKMILPIRYRHVNIDSQGFVVEYEDYTMKRLNFDLTVKDHFVCSEINTVSYPSGKMDKNGEEILQPSRCLYYKSGSWMDKDSEKVGLMSQRASHSLNLYMTISLASALIYTRLKMQATILSSTERVNLSTNLSLPKRRWIFPWHCRENPPFI